jgi:hypothetical protein
LLARQLSRSDLDSAAVLFRTDLITQPARFRAALERLAAHSPERRLARVNASALIAAQREDAFTIETLCAVAGLSYGDLNERVADLPAAPGMSWAASQLRAAFSLIDDIVNARVSPPLPDTVPTGPLELMPGLGFHQGSGWGAIEAQLDGGVPYEVLLAQRAAGGTWLAHRNATSGLLNHQVAHLLAAQLDDREVTYHLSTLVGGAIPPSTIQRLASSDKQIGLVSVDQAGRAVAAVVFASARDSGTASKSAARLRAMRRDPDLPVALVLTGRGWSARNETAELAIDFGGRVYSELSLDALANEIARLAGVNAKP